MKSGSAARKLFVGTVAAMTIYGCAGPKPYVPPDYLTKLLTLDTPNYRGGLTPEDRDVADKIHRALVTRYYTTCGDANPFAGVLISIGDNQKPLPLLDRVDPDLAFLIRALDSPRQEVRDVASYIIGLLGPSASAAQPFLERKFTTQDGFGRQSAAQISRSGWYNFALENVSCQPIASPSVAAVVPETVRGGDYPGKNDAYVAASLYLDAALDFPPGLLEAAVSDSNLVGDSPGPLLAKILADDSLGVRKQGEAAAAIHKIGGTYREDALPALLHLADSSDGKLRYFVAENLVALHHERAIPLLIDQIREDNWVAGWEQELCAFGEKAQMAEDKLIQISRSSSTWPRVALAAVNTLGCIGSRKSVPELVMMLAAPDWQLNIAAAKALGKIGDRSVGVVAALDRQLKNHWSARVKLASFNALSALHASPSSQIVASGHVKDDAEPEVLGGPYPFDHGLPYCDEAARYSIDGRKWFNVRWIQPKLEAVPRGFRPKGNFLLQEVGSQTFLRVNDGWLFGSDGFESEGVFAHVSDSGVVTEMEGQPGSLFGQASIVGIVRVRGKYVAFGYEVLKVGAAGVLFGVTKDSAGKWAAERLLVLPSPPASHAIAPSGELLLSDGPNDYAIVANQIVPLKCEKTLPGSFFSRQ